jgi:hypothetical protein
LITSHVGLTKAVVKSGIASERGQINTRVIHGTVGVGCLLKAAQVLSIVFMSSTG